MEWIKSMKKAIVLVSGGMDSLVSAGIAHAENDELYFLHVNYGQRTENRELNSFNSICLHFKPIQSKIINIDYLKDFGGNSLTDYNIEIPQTINKNTVPNTYVPFRNGNLISIATAWAEVISAESIYIGAVEEDSSGYPDCRKDFFDKLELAINAGTKDSFNVKICTPVINMSKAQIIRKAFELNIPLDLSWSCYSDNNLACGKCDSCRLRLKAFEEAGFKDPIKYR